MASGRSMSEAHKMGCRRVANGNVLAPRSIRRKYGVQFMSNCTVHDILTRAFKDHLYGVQRSQAVKKDEPIQKRLDQKKGDLLHNRNNLAQLREAIKLISDTDEDALKVAAESEQKFKDVIMEIELSISDDNDKLREIWKVVKEKEATARSFMESVFVPAAQ